MNTNQKFKYLEKNLSKVTLIHCSTSGLHDSDSGLSPRITGIVTHNIEHDVTHNFSYYIVAERNGITKKDISDHYDEIEKIMLEDFFAFAEQSVDKLWVHWNMTSIIFGFQLLEHRYEVLTKTKPYIIPDEKKYNLSLMIRKKYGRSGENGPKMRFLMELNNDMHRDFVDGIDEIELFEKKEFIRLQRSTTCKVIWFEKALKKAISGELKARKFTVRSIASDFFDSVYVKSLGFIAILFSVYQIGLIVIRWLTNRL